MPATSQLSRSFTIPFAAYVTGVSTDIIKRWVFGEGGNSVLGETEPEDAEYLDFYDVIEVMHVNSLRQKHIPLQKIREAVNFVREKHGILHPFARKHEILVFGTDIFITLPGDRTVQATGDLRNQQAMKQIIEPFAEKIHHNPKTGMAERYVAMKRGKWTVELNANKGMGLPMVVPAYSSVASLLHAVKSEGSIEDAALIHDVPIDAVKIAVEYDQERQSRRNAA